MVRARLLPLVVLLLCALASCGTGETGPAPEHPEDWRIPYLRYCPLDLPEAAHARFDRDPAEHLLVCLMPSGDVELEGERWILLTETERERLNALTHFEVVLGERVGSGLRLTLRMQIDADARWRNAGAVLRIAGRVAGPDLPLLWNVASSATLRSVHQAVRMLPIPEEPTALPTVVIRARPPPDGVHHRVEMELAAAGEVLTRVEEDYECDERAATRAAWEAAAARWGPWIGEARRVRLEIVDEARGDARRFAKWSHVAQVLDLLWGHGVRTVDFAGLGVRLELMEPEDLSEDPFVLPDDPVATPVVVLLATCMVLTAFLLTFLPLWLGRSARKRPARS